MKRVNFFKMAMLAFAAAAVIGCEQQDPTGEGTGNGDGSTLNENLTFTLALKDVLANSVTITVSHDGATTDTWYGFVTTDTESDEEDLIKAEVKNLLEKGNGKITGLKKAKNTNDKISDLEASTDYRYIVTGLTSNGTSYGKPASLDFSTTSDRPDGFTATEDWAITYKGRTEDENGSQVEVFAVETESQDYYYVTSYPTYLLTDENFGYTDDELVNDIISTVSYYLSGGIDLLGSGSLDWNEPRLTAGEYRVYAVGFQANGQPTYSYSYADIEILEEEATADYLKWIGTWNMTSSAGVLSLSGQNVDVPSVTYVVTIDHYDNNYMYAVKGWEMEGASMVDFSQYYSPEELMFPAYFTDGQLEIQEYDLFPTADSETATSATHYFGIYGYGDITEGSETFSGPLGFSGYGIPMAVTSTDGDKTMLEGFSITEEGMAIAYRAMGYMEMPLTENGYVMFYNYPAFFPITMEKVETGTSSVMKRMSVSETARFKTDLGLNKKKDLEPRQHKLVKKAL